MASKSHCSICHYRSSFIHSFIHSFINAFIYQLEYFYHLYKRDNKTENLIKFKAARKHCKETLH